MKRKILSFLFIFLLIISVILPLRGSVGGQNPVDNSLKIFAIMYNSLEIGDDEKGEAVCLMNTGSNTIDISNYKITDFEGSVKIPSGTYIAPSVRIWVAREATEFYNEFGFKPNFEYGKDTDPTVPNLTQDNGTFPIFDNSGDECAILDNSGNIVDLVAWGNSAYSGPGWSGPKINPYLFASYISADGDIAYRKLDETTGQPIADTNTASDWSWDPNDPISGCKIMYPGWDTWDLFPRTVKHSGIVTTTFALSPDNAFYALRDAIRSAQSSIKIELYTITSLELMQEILNKMDQGVKVKVLMDGEVYGATGGTYDQVRWFVTQVVNKGGTAYFLRNPQGSPYPHDRYNNVHIKTIIIDDSKVFISADNLTGSSMPSDDLSDGTAGNRGATVLTNDPVIVQGVLNIFNHDFNIGYYDASPYNPATDAPPSSYYPYRWGNHSGYIPVQPQPLTVTEYEELELVQSPDTSIKGTEGIIGLINRAGVNDLIIDEAQYEDLYWGQTGSQYINPRLQAMIAAAQRGAQVYLLLDSVNSASTNTTTKNYIDSLGLSNIHVLLGNPTSGTGSFPIHNKMILARIGGKDYVNIASINGSENASRANRELGLIIQSDAGYEYYYKAFEYDWKVSGGGSIIYNPNASYFSIYAVSTQGGSIDPSGKVSLPSGSSATFKITPYEGYKIKDILVDGVSVGAISTYTFTNITSDHKIEAAFEPITFTLTASASPGGVVSPSGTLIVNYGDSKTFSINPDIGYHIADVKVDGKSVGALLTYTLANITDNHVIEAIFAINTYNITASATSGGSISPSGTITVNYGDSKTFTITPDKGYRISDVKVDGVSVGAISTYTFTNITSDHKIEAIFEKNEIVIILQIGKTTFTVNGATQNLDSPPIIKNGRTLLPIRTLIETLGGKVNWNATEQKVTITLNGHTVVLYINKTTAIVDGKNTTLDVAPTIINGRTYLPLRFISESLGLTVDWDPQTQTITIYYWK